MPEPTQRPAPSKSATPLVAVALIVLVAVSTAVTVLVLSAADARGDTPPGPAAGGASLSSLADATTTPADGPKPGLWLAEGDIAVRFENAPAWTPAISTSP